MVRFEWDEAKNAANLVKHGIGFEVAIAVFEGPVLTWTDPRSYGEVRAISAGQIGQCLVLIVVHTDRSGVTRIISARKANRAERMLYHAHLEKKTGRN